MDEREIGARRRPWDRCKVVYDYGVYGGVLLRTQPKIKYIKINGPRSLFSVNCC